MSTENIKLIGMQRKWGGGGGGGGGGMGGGEGKYIYIYIHISTCHHQNDSCIKMGSNESHFNVSLIVRDKVARQCPQTITFEEIGELKWIQTEVAPLSLTLYR